MRSKLHIKCHNIKKNKIQIKKKIKMNKKDKLLMKNKRSNKI